MTKQTKFASSITLTLALWAGSFVLTSDSKAADSFEDFHVQVSNPYVDSVSAYHLNFTLSGETYGRLNNSRLTIEFPRGFGLESIDSVSLSTDHPDRQYRIERISIDAEKLTLQLEKTGADDDGGDRIGATENRVNFNIGIFVVQNPTDTGHFQLTASAFKREDLIAGPSMSEPFEIIEFDPEPKGELQIVSTELIAPNSPKVNTGQSFQVRVIVKNLWHNEIPNVIVRMKSDGSSSISRPQFFEVIPPFDSVIITFDVTAGGSSNPSEKFTAQVIAGDNRITVIDNEAIAIIQTPANLVLTTSIADGDTLFVSGGEQYNFTFSVTNMGQASISVGKFQLDGPSGEIGPIGGIGGVTVTRRYLAPPFDTVLYHSLKIIEIPIDLNNLNPAPISDTEIQFTVVVDVEGDIDFEDSFIVENNPFNPLDGPDTFVYNLSDDSNVEFRIFTITGEEVHYHKYLSGSQGGKSGTNQIQWDGRNTAGEMVLNGVYVTMLNVLSTGETASLKLAVLK